MLSLPHVTNDGVYDLDPWNPVRRLNQQQDGEKQSGCINVRLMRQ